MASGALPDNPFVAAGMIEDPRLFVGRKDELHAIASRMIGDQPTSINIVGEKHIGKSSLLHYFVLTWQQRVLQNTSRYVVIYLPLRGVDCQTETGFYEAVAEGLLSHVQGWQQGSLQKPWKTKPLNRQAFSDAVKQWKQQGKLPVLCLDDFESLLKYPDKFDNGFYDNLRSLMDSNALMLVVASRKQLDIYANEHRFVSSFFNIGHTIYLKELTTDEAIELSRLPTRSTNGAALNEKEQSDAQQWGSRHPYKLQLAGYYLWEARQQGKAIKWAKQQFDQQLTNHKSKAKGKWWQLLLGWLWDIPLRLGRIATSFIGKNCDDVQNRIIGMLILIVIGLGLVRVLTLLDVQQWLGKILGWLWDIPLRLGRLATFIGTSWDDVQNRIIGMLILIVIGLGLVRVLKLPDVQQWLGKIFNFVK